MDAPKQIIVVRKDLNMGKGKIAAQVAHASMGAALSGMAMIATEYSLEFMVNRTSPLAHWLIGQFTKVCVCVNSEQELDDIYQAALTANIPAKLIVDSGLTAFHGIPTKTCVGIGPDYPSVLDKITGHLKLL